MRQWELNYALQKQQQADSLTDKEYEREWQERKYQDSLNQYALEMALKTGDFSKLAESGYNTDYLKQMQQAELEKMALEAAKLRSQLNKSGSGGGYSSNNEKEPDPTPQQLTDSGLLRLFNTASVLGINNKWANAAYSNLNATGKVSDNAYKIFANAMNK